MNQDSNLKLTGFDRATGSAHLQMLKAALPYLGEPGRKILPLFIRFAELRRTVRLLNQDPDGAVSICSLGSDSAAPFDMLRAICPYASPKEQEFIETALNFMQGNRGKKVPEEEKAEEEPSKTDRKDWKKDPRLQKLDESHRTRLLRLADEIEHTPKDKLFPLLRELTEGNNAADFSPEERSLLTEILSEQLPAPLRSRLESFRLFHHPSEEEQAEPEGRRAK